MIQGGHAHSSGTALNHGSQGSPRVSVAISSPRPSDSGIRCSRRTADQGKYRTILVLYTWALLSHEHLLCLCR